MGTIEIVTHTRTGRDLLPTCRRLLRGLLRETGREHDGVTLLLSTDTVLRRLNRTHRGQDRATDVLSFPFHGDLEPRRPHLGDIAISMQRASRQARSAGWPLASELALLLTHGFLHLLGYDHETDDGTMHRLEDSLLRRLAKVDLGGRRRLWGATRRQAGAKSRARRRRAGDP
jgi:probable rRNA maturation factor